MRLRNAPTALPRNKVLASSAGVLLANVIFSILEQKGIAANGEVKTAVTTLLVFTAGYLIPDRAYS